jgi:sialate O-acetylesterase
MGRRALYISGILFFLQMAWARPSMAEIRLPKLLSDHAVLQRDAPIRIWGWADPDAELSVDFHKQHVTTTSDRLGEWVAWLMPETAGGPFSLTISNGHGETASRVDILVGDVWLASGQSNMEMPLLGFGLGTPVKDGPAEIAAANHPKLRLLLVPQSSSAFPLDDQPGSWKVCTPETAAHFSAVAYFFGRGLSEKEQVPIGLIDSTWGGTPADSWVSMDAFGHNPALIPAFASRASFSRNITKTEVLIAAEKREDEAAKAAGKPIPSHAWHPNPASWMPSGLYNGMIAPLTQYSIKGFLWYQGETNSSHDRAPYYHQLFEALIDDWRQHFAQGDLPFLYAQISSFNSPGEDWATVRDAQRRTLSLRNTAMAVTLDRGLADNVHPPDKQTVAARLALAARAVAYHEAVPYQSPLFREATSEPGALRVWFDHAEGLSSKGGPLTGFEVAGSDHRFMPAEATIDGSTIIVKNAALGHPVFVRYGWSSFVHDSFYNAANLPASTFTSEDDPRHDN